MKQTDSLKRIDMPNENKENRYVNYENKLKPMLDFENEELKSLYFQHEQQLLAMAEKEAWDYFFDALFPGFSMFFALGHGILNQAKVFHAERY